MNIFLILELIGLLLSQAVETRPTGEQNPMLYRILEVLGVKHLMEADNNRQALLDYLSSTMGILEGKFAYYQSQTFHTCFALEQYLEELFQSYGNGHKEYPKTLAIMICATGNRSVTTSPSDAVNTFISEGRHLMRQILDDADARGAKIDPNYHSFLVSNLMYVDKILELVDVFSTSQQGMLAGVEEYAPVDENFLVPVDENLFVAGTCTNDTECKCGCQFDHPIRIIEGLEDLFNGLDTENARYTLGVCAARSDNMKLIEGTEGKVFDAIKEMGKKALDALTETFKAIMETFEADEEDEAKVKQVLDIAEKNKKALQAVKNKSLTINAAAKEGVHKLADQTDPSGAMRNIVTKLNAVSNAASVIDALMGLLRKEVKSSSAIVTAHKDADAALKALKSATSQPPRGDENNNEVVKAEREAMNKKIAEAKTALKGLKKGVSEHNKRFNGIKKAISGISPHIFPDIEEKKEEKK